jgi:hypothetical protein
MNKHIIGVVTATILSTGMAYAKDQVCEGSIHSGHRSNASSVYIIKNFENNPWHDIQCWFEDGSSFGNKIFDTCLGNADNGTVRDYDKYKVCRITGVIHPTRRGNNKGTPQVLNLTKVEIHDITPKN